MTNTPIDIDAMLAKREEEVGYKDRFPFIAAGKTWWAVDPTLAADEWLDELDELNDERDDDDAPTGDYRDGLVDLYLGDQAEAFRAAGGQSRHLNAALRIYLEQQRTDPTLQPSRSTRRRSKRR